MTRTNLAAMAVRAVVVVAAAVMLASVFLPALNDALAPVMARIL